MIEKELQDLAAYINWAIAHDGDEEAVLYTIAHDVRIMGRLLNGESKVMAGLPRSSGYKAQEDGNE